MSIPGNVLSFTRMLPRTRHERLDHAAVAVAPARVAVGWRLAAAGGVAGALTNCVLFPLDTVKTIRQADPSKFPGALPAALSVLRTKGLSGLYSGISPALVGSALSSALYFGTYELVRRHIRRISASDGRGVFASPLQRMPGNAIAAASGNIASSVLFVPKEVVKQRMQAGLDSGRFVGAAIGLVRADGIAGLYRGYKATLLRNIPSTMLRFVLYEEAKLILQGSARNPVVLNSKGNGRGKSKGAVTPVRQISTVESVAAGAVSGGISSAITTPMDVIKTQYATGKAARSSSILRVARGIVQERGVGGLYVGIQPRVVWSALFAAIGFSSYELCKKLLAPAYSIENPDETLLEKPKGKRKLQRR